MQFIVISHQLWEAAVAVLLGFFLGIVYDAVRFVRMLLSPLRRELLFANLFDIIYLLFCGVCYCIFVYAASSGHFRWFTALATVIGFFIYRLLLSRVLMCVFKLISIGIKKLLMVFLYPLKIAVLLFKRLFVLIGRAVLRKRSIRKTENMKKELHQYVKLS